MSRALSWLRKLGWKKWLLIVASVVIIILVVVVAVPAIMYYSRNRHPVDYSETLAQATAVYSVTYESDGFSDNSTFTRKVIEIGVKEDSQICRSEAHV